MLGNIKLKNQKIKIRSTKELRFRKIEFLELCKILDKLQIKYFLLGGVLLGAVREKKFISWDWDVEICVFSNETKFKYDKLIKAICKKKFILLKNTRNPSNLKIDLYGKFEPNITKYTIMGWNHDKKNKIYWRNTLKIPEHYIKNMKKIKFYDKFHYAPFPPRDYLTYQYGNWQKPLRTSNKYFYLTKKYYGRNIFSEILRKISQLLMKIL